MNGMNGSSKKRTAVAAVAEFAGLRSHGRIHIADSMLAVYCHKVVCESLDQAKEFWPSVTSGLVGGTRILLQCWDLNLL
jgi:hypothetical protein